MNEELKVIIKAEVDKLKKGIDDAKKQMSGFKEQVQKASGDVDSKMKKMGESIGKAVKTGAKVAVASIATVTTAVASVVTASVKSYAEYEQLAGGVEKLFGKSAKTIMKYANSAYKDAGINANQYMRNLIDINMYVGEYNFIMSKINSDYKPSEIYEKKKNFRNMEYEKIGDYCLIKCVDAYFMATYDNLSVPIKRYRFRIYDCIQPCPITCSAMFCYSFLFSI